jgi:hypothetical protein
MAPHLHTRIRRLERRSQLLTGALIVGLAFALTGFARQDEPVTVRCARLELLDAQGRTLATLGTDADGASGFFLHDEAGGLRASLTHDAGQTALFLYDGEAVVRVGAAHFAHGGSGFALHGPNSEGSAVLYYKGSGSLRFFEPDGTPTLVLPAPEAAPGSGPGTGAAEER